MDDVCLPQLWQSTKVLLLTEALMKTLRTREAGCLPGMRQPSNVYFLSFRRRKRICSKIELESTNASSRLSSYLRDENNEKKRQKKIERHEDSAEDSGGSERATRYAE